MLYFSGVRPFGVSLLIAGWDEDRPYLFQCDPSVGFIVSYYSLAVSGNFCCSFERKLRVNQLSSCI